MGMASADQSEKTSIRPGFAPLTQKLAARVEDDNAMVAIAIGDIDIAVRRIDCDIGRLVEKERTLVSPGLAALFIAIVADAFPADLQQQAFAIMRPFLDNPIAAAADPDVVPSVDETAMDRFRHLLRIAPGVHEVSSGIIFDDNRRGLLADSLLHRREIGPVHAEDVIMPVNAHAADRARHPSIWQRFWPEGVDDEARDVAVRRSGWVV
jgi:hypothetical protein